MSSALRYEALEPPRRMVGWAAASRKPIQNRFVRACEEASEALLTGLIRDSRGKSAEFLVPPTMV